MFQLMDAYTAVLSAVFLAFCEVVAVCWIFGNILQMPRSSGTIGCCNTFELIGICHQRCSQNLLDVKEDAGLHAEHLLSFLLESSLSSLDTGEFLLHSHVICIISLGFSCVSYNKYLGISFHSLSSRPALPTTPLLVMEATHTQCGLIVLAGLSHWPPLCGSHLVPFTRYTKTKVLLFK